MGKKINIVKDDGQMDTEDDVIGVVHKTLGHIHWVRAGAKTAAAGALLYWDKKKKRVELSDEKNYEFLEDACEEHGCPETYAYLKYAHDMSVVKQSGEQYVIENISEEYPQFIKDRRAGVRDGKFVKSAAQLKEEFMGRSTAPSAASAPEKIKRSRKEILGE